MKRLSAILLVCSVGAAQAKHRNWPDLPKNSYAGKRLRVVAVVAKDNPSLSDLHKFNTELVKSDWYRKLGETYNWGTTGIAENWTIDPVNYAPAAHDAATLSAWVASEVTSHKLKPDPMVRTIFALFLPQRVVSRLPQPGGSPCGAGNHFLRLTGTGFPGDAMALISACSGSTSVASLNAQTTTASHEIAESATDTTDLQEIEGGFRLHDPPSNSPWVRGNKDNQEVGDMCQGTRMQVSGFNVERIYSGVSNGKGDAPCLPADDPYYSVSTDKDWYTVDSGKSIEITVDGWANGKAGEWDLAAMNQFCSNTSRQTTLSLSAAKIGDGKSVKLTVKAPTWLGGDPHCIIELASSGRAGDSDTKHEWRIGVAPSALDCPIGQTPPKLLCHCPNKPPFCTTITACEHECGGNIPGK